MDDMVVHIVVNQVRHHQPRLIVKCDIHISKERMRLGIMSFDFNKLIAMLTCPAFAKLCDSIVHTIHE